MPCEYFNCVGVYNVLYYPVVITICTTASILQTLRFVTDKNKNKNSEQHLCLTSSPKLFKNVGRSGRSRSCQVGKCLELKVPHCHIFTLAVKKSKLSYKYFRLCGCIQCLVSSGFFYINICKTFRFEGLQVIKSTGHHLHLPSSPILCKNAGKSRNFKDGWCLDLKVPHLSHLYIIC